MGHDEIESHHDNVIVEGPLTATFNTIIWFFMQWSWGAIVAVWFAFVMALDYFTAFAPLGLDAFYVYYEAAENLAQGAGIYSGLEGWIYLYPPLLAQLLMPLVYHGSVEIAVHVWLGVNVGLIAVSLHMLTRYVPREYHKLLWLSPVFFVPIWQAFYIGQVTVIMLALLVAVWVGVREDKPVLAGMVLALAAWIKVFPALLVVYFIWRRDWRVIRGVAVAGFGLLALQVAVSGLDVMVEFFGVLMDLFISGQPAVTYENLSIFGFASRLFQTNMNVVPILVDDGLFINARIALTAGFFMVTAFAIAQSGLRDRWYLRGEKDQYTWRFDVEYALVILTTLMIGSTLWISGLPPVLLISVLILRNTTLFHSAVTSRLVWLTAIFMLVFYQPLIVFMATAQRAIGAVTLSVGFFGIVLLWGLMVVLLLSPPLTESE